MDPHTQEARPSVFDVAACILGKMGSMTTWKLQKLVYYCQAWSLAWDDDVLFPEEIQAWANGPVVPALYAEHRGEYRVSRLSKGDLSILNHVQRETVDAVLAFYGDKSPQWLSDLTHMEDPWKKARVGVPEGERGDHRITEESLAEYYGSLEPDVS